MSKTYHAVFQHGPPEDKRLMVRSAGYETYEEAVAADNGTLVLLGAVSSDWFTEVFELRAALAAKQEEIDELRHLVEIADRAIDRANW